MTRKKCKRKSSSDFHKLIHKFSIILDKVYKILRVIDLIVKLFH